MNRRFRVLCLLALLPACADSCGCGEQQVARKPAVAGAGSAGASGSGTSAQGGAGGDPYKHLRNELKPMPESDLKQQLEQAAKAIDGKSDLGAPIGGATLAKVLPDDIEDYEATGPARTGTSPAELGEATVASRQYKQGKALMTVKITDTSDSPQVRAELVPQLTAIGNAPTGEQRGAIDDGVVGITAHHAQVNASRAIALVGGRFLVEVMVDNTIKPDDAWTAVIELDADDLIDAAKAARKAEKPK